MTTTVATSQELLEQLDALQPRLATAITSGAAGHMMTLRAQERAVMDELQRRFPAASQALHDAFDNAEEMLLACPAAAVLAAAVREELGS
jgi:hypothetical protein